jgi:hypothetical protein
MHKKHTHINDSYLVEQYTIKLRPSTDLARELNVSDWWVRDRLKTLGVKIRRQGGALKAVDLMNQRFGKYVVVRKLDIPGNAKGAIWQVRCDCGNVRELLSNLLRSGQVQSCGKCEEHYAWKGVGELSGSYFTTLKRGADKREIYFNITKEYLWNLYLKQNRKCALSGLEIFFTRDRSSQRSCAQTASLDRIDSSKGYIEGNVQWVHKAINLMKWHLKQHHFIELCKHVAKHAE